MTYIPQAMLILLRFAALSKRKSV